MANFTAVLLFILIASGTVQAITGGPDQFGYSFIDSDSGETFNWIEISSSGESLGLDDDDSDLIPIGFNFTFYKKEYDRVYVSSNGFIAFLSSGTTSTGGRIPDYSSPNAVIAPFWDDLDPSEGGEVYYQTFSTSSGKYLVVEWYNVPSYSAEDDATFEAILYENGDIKFQYKDVYFGDPDYDYGMSATVGIEDENGTSGLLYSYHSPSLKESLAIMFYYPTLLVRKLGPSQALSGETVTYNITYRNMYWSNITNLSIYDRLDSNFTYVSDTCNGTLSGNVLTMNIGEVANGTSGFCLVNVTISSNVKQGTHLKNIAHILFTDPDGIRKNRTAISETIIPNPEVEIEKTGNVCSAQQGETIQYTISYRNPSIVTAKNLTIVDRLPSGVSYVGDNFGGLHSSGVVTFTVGDVAPGQSGNITVTVNVTSDYGVLQNNITAYFENDDGVRFSTSNTTYTGVGFDITVAGSGQGDYTSIQKAIDNAMPGDRIFICPGEYTETVDVWKSVTIVGASPDSTVVSGNVPNVYDSVFDVMVPGVTISSLTIKSRGSEAGIYGKYIRDINIHGNVITGSPGISIYQSSNVKITENNVRNGGDDGIYLSYTEGVYIANNSINNNAYAGISAWYAKDTVIKNNDLSDNSDGGVSVHHSDNTTVLGNIIANRYHSGTGIYLYSSKENLVKDNILNKNYNGISLENSEISTLLNNTINSSLWYGLLLDTSVKSTLRDNRVNHAGYSYYISGYGDMHYNNDIDTSNLANGKPLYYLRNVTGMVFDSTDVAAFYCIMCEGVTLKNERFTNASSGVLFWKTNNSVIENVSVSDSEMGVHLQRSHNNIIRNSQKTFTGNEYGIYLLMSGNNTIENVRVENSTYTGIYFDRSNGNAILGSTITGNLWNGIYFTMSGNNTVRNNSVTGNYDGIYIENSDYNLFERNTVRFNRYAGIELYYSNNNTISNNTVLNNSYYDFLIFGASKGNTGTGNLCELPDGWSDLNTDGCTQMARSRSSYPDLTVTNLSINPSSFSTGTWVQIIAEVRNVGSSNTTGGFYVGFYLDDYLIGLSYIPSLPAGGNITVSYWWYVTMGGDNRTLKAVVDHTNLIFERNESNNDASLVIPEIPGYDGVVSSITWNPVNFSAGDTVTFYVTVKNAGKTSGPWYGWYSITLYIDDRFIGTQYHYWSSWPVNSTITKSFTWKAYPGNHTIRAVFGGPTGEMDTGNNERVMHLYLSGPDLIVENISYSPSSYNSGDAVTVNATIKNVGDGETGVHSGSVAFYDSNHLFAVENYSNINIPPQGAIHVTSTWIAQGGNQTIRVVADHGNKVLEHNETNNESEIALPFVTPPDLTVVDLTWSPASYSSGDTVVLNATIKNAGSVRMKGNVSVSFYYRNTTLIGSSSKQLDLYPGDTGYVTKTWKAQTGDYYFRASVDPDNTISESNESNNDLYVKAPSLPLPDLVVSDITLDPQSLQGGDRVTIGASIKNNGGGFNSTNLTFRLYVDDMLISTDTFQLSLAGNASQNITFSSKWTATPGPHRVRIHADVNSVLDELDEDNVFLFGIIVPRPDIIVKDIFWSPLNYSAGQSVTITATIKNNGTGNTYGYLYVLFYVDDAYIGYSYYPYIIPPGGEVNLSRSWIAQGGNHTIRVVADGWNNILEEREDNNERTEELSPVLFPDLIVENITWTPSTFITGQVVTIKATVRNIGKGNISDGYRDVVFYIDGKYVGRSYNYTPVPSNGSFTVKTSWIATPGNHTVRAVVDPYDYIAESNEGNNYMVRQMPGVAAPDLVIENITWAPANFDSGDQITLIATVRNVGEGDLASTYLYVMFYVDGESIGFGYRQGELPVNGTIEISRTWIVTPGNHTLTAFVDPFNYLAELNESNNRYSRNLPPTSFPDLIVENVSWEPKTGLRYGDQVTINALVRNTGSGNFSNCFNTRFYVDNRSIGESYRCGLDVNESFLASRKWSAEPGNHTIMVVADSYSSIPESNERNNVKSVTMNVNVPLPDFTVDSITVPTTTLVDGRSADVIVTISNLGPGDVAGGYVDVAIIIDGKLVKKESVFGGVSAGASQRIALPIVLESGTHTMRVVADYGNRFRETNESNNELVKSLNFSITPPDLTVTSIRLSDPNPAIGEHINIYANITNLGGETLRCLGVDFYMDGRHLGRVQQRVACGILAGQTLISTWPWLAEPGNHTITVVVDGQNAIPESNESNNTLTVSMPQIPYPDFTITNISYSVKSNQLQPNEKVPITVTVRNNGSADFNQVVYVLLDVGGRKITGSVSGIPSGESRNVTLVWVATPGSNFTARATVDYADEIPESNETNNERSILLPINVPYPDLIVESITWEPGSGIRDEQTVTFNMTIRNIGAGVASGFYASLSVGKERITGYISSLPPGSSKSLVLEWRAKAGENFRVSGYADSTNRVIESNESNNVLSAGEISQVIPVERFSVSIDPAQEVIGIGESGRYSIQINNFGSASSNYSINISGIDPSWYSLERKTVYLGPGEVGTIGLNVTVPFDCSLNTSPRTVEVAVTSLITNASKTASSQLTIDKGYTILDVLPKNNTKTGSTEITVSWKTRTNATSKVYLREAGSTNWTVFTGENGYLHSVAVSNLTRNAWNEFYVESNNTCGSGSSGIYRVYVDNGVSFEPRQYTFNINRDYNQHGLIYVKNTDSVPHQVVLEVNNPYDDIIVGFVGEGSVDRPIVLYPGEKKAVDFRMHAQDAMKGSYEMVVNLTNYDLSGRSENITDHATIRINVHVPVINFTVVEVDSNPLTLEKTFRVVNYGDTVTDLRIYADDSIKEKVIFEPSYDHGYLPSGGSITFKAKPVLEVGSTGFNGTIFVSGAGRVMNITADFHTLPGERIFKARYPVKTLNFSKTFDEDNSSLTNPLNGSVVPAVMINGTLVFMGDVVVQVLQNNNPVKGTNVSLFVSGPNGSVVLHGTSDPLGFINFRITGPPGNYTYRAEITGYNTSTETRSFTVSTSSSISIDPSIRWVEIGDFNSTYSGEDDNIVLDSAPFYFIANVTSPLPNATPILILEWDILPTQKVTVNGIVNGTRIEFPVRSIPPANYTAYIVLVSNNSAQVSPPKNISVTDYSLANLKQQTIVRNFRINESSDNITSLTIIAKEEGGDPRKTIVLTDVRLNDERTAFIYTFSVMANETFDDVLIVRIMDSNDTVVHYQEQNISFVANVPVQIEVSVPVEYATGEYTIEVVTLDSYFTKYLVKPIVKGTLTLFGVSSTTASKVSHVTGALVDCALAFTPVGQISSIVDLAIDAFKMFWYGDIDSIAGTVKGSATQGLNQLNKIADAKIAEKLMEASKITKAGKAFTHPLFSCILDLIDAIKNILSEDGTTMKKTQKNWRCTNRPVVNDPIKIPSDIEEYLDDGTYNIDWIAFETVFSDFWAMEGLSYFDTIFEWNGYRFAGIYNDIPLGPYFFVWNNPDPAYIHTSSEGSGMNYITTYTRGLNPGHYAQNYETTVYIHAKQATVTLSAKDQAQANQRTILLIPSYQGKPDLAIPLRDLVVNNTNPGVGETVEITAVVHNMGSEYVSKAKVYFYDNDNIIGSTSAYLLSPGTSRTIRISYPVTDPGDHRISAVVDPFNEISEESEDNNRATVTITASTVKAPSLPDLVPVSMDFTPSAPKENETVTATVTVRNLGNTTLTDPVNISLVVNSPAQNFHKLVNMNGVAQVNVSFSFATSAGNHTVTVIVDVQNRIEESNETNNVLSESLLVQEVDTTPPLITIISPENRTYNTSTVELAVVADEPVVSWWYSLDGMSNVTFTPNTTLTNLSEGSHRLDVYAEDLAGNVGHGSVVFVVNTSITVIPRPSLPDLVPVSMDFTPSAPKENETVTATVTVRNLGNTTLTDPVNISLVVNSPAQNFHKLVNMNGVAQVNVSFSFATSAGNHTVTVIVDGEDAINESDETNNILVGHVYVQPPSDTTPPAISFVPPTPASGAVLNQNYVIVKISSNEPLSRAILEWDGVNESMTGSGVSWHTNKTDLYYRTYTYRVYARDVAGNWNVSETRTVTLKPSNAVEISTCTNLSSPGYYLMVDDISNSSTCILISSSDVVLDGAGHTISGQNAPMSRGISVISGSVMGNISIRNVQVVSWDTGIHSENATVEILGSTISGGSYGIHIKNSSSNRISGNIITGTSSAGIWLEMSGSNLIYNNLFNSSVNFKISGNESSIWNVAKTSGENIVGGPFIAGNYWAKPDGTGFSQTCSDSDFDGICDSPYTLNANNTDNLPLSTPPDTTPPLITIISPENRTYNTSTVELAVVADEPVVSWWYSLDGMSNVTFTPNTTLTNLSEGSHRLDVYAEDLAGNVGHGSVVFEISTAPVYKKYSLTGKIYLSGNVSGKIVVEVFASLPLANATPVNSTTMPAPGNYTFRLPNGTYYIRAFADVNGNLIHDGGEPIGFAINRTSPYGADAIVVAGGDAGGADVMLIESVPPSINLAANRTKVAIAYNTSSASYTTEKVELTILASDISGIEIVSIRVENETSERELLNLTPASKPRVYSTKAILEIGSPGVYRILAEVSDAYNNTNVSQILLSAPAIIQTGVSNGTSSSVSVTPYAEVIARANETGDGRINLTVEVSRLRPETNISRMGDEVYYLNVSGSADNVTSVELTLRFDPANETPVVYLWNKTTSSWENVMSTGSVEVNYTSGTIKINLSALAGVKGMTLNALLSDPIFSVVNAPDLTIRDIAAPSSATKGSTQTIAVTVQNAGKSNATNAVVVLEANGASVSRKTIPLLTSGESKVVKFTWTPTKATVYKLIATADPDDAIVEANESNNNMSVSVSVKAPSVSGGGYAGGGGVTITPAPTVTPTATPELTPTPAPTPKPTGTPEVKKTQSPTPTPEKKETPKPAPTHTPTETPVPKETTVPEKAKPWWKIPGFEAMLLVISLSLALIIAGRRRKV